MYERVPQELKNLNRWHVWRYLGDQKMPLQVDGSAAKSNDPTTWTDFETAADAAQFFTGLAFELGEGYVGVDLDNCFDESSKLRPWAIPVLSRFDGLSFMEVSPSGTGIKLITRGKKPEKSRCKMIIDTDKQQIECYESGRFWAITGDTYAGNDEILNGQQAIDWLLNEYFKTEEQDEQKPAEEPAKEFRAPSVPLNPVNGIERRVESYLQSIKQASEGNRNSSAFSLAGHLRAFNHEGQKLTEDQILEYCRDWNSRNTPPLSDSELQKAIKSSGVNGTPRSTKPKTNDFRRIDTAVDLSGILGQKRTEDFDDELFCLESLPERGLIREVFDYYWQSSMKKSSVMGLAVAVSLCETIFGRRVASHTDMRTNDYNVVIAPTASGKEACETTITKILQAAGNVCIIPPDVQSGNGLVKAVCAMPCGIWICDEFGKMLKGILDERSGNAHAKQISTHLLKLYSKSAGIYAGAAHADGVRNQVDQPHLVLLGLTTGQVFKSLTDDHLNDGLIGRIAFWPVQERPRRKQVKAIPVPDNLSGKVACWLQWNPLTGNIGTPAPRMLEMTDEALDRWSSHAETIDEKMDKEGEFRAAIWGRVAARAMKLSLVHRAARITQDPSTIDWGECPIDLQDINWGIRLANWLARISCSIIKESMTDTQSARAREIILKAVDLNESVSRRDLMREFRSISGSDFTAAASELERCGGIEIINEQTSGRPKVTYRKKTQTESVFA